MAGRRPLALLIALALLAPPAAGAPAGVPADSPVGVAEPADLYTGPTQGYTPTTLAGAQVIDRAGLERLLAGGRPVLVDVGLKDHRPAGLPPGTIWLPTHRSIPGAVWLPDAGAAPMAPGAEAAYLARIDALTAGDRGRPVVVFCHPECWGSWNAAKRLVRAGYTGVHWFPDGVEGWQEANDTGVVRPDPAWTAAAGERAGAEAQR